MMEAVKHTLICMDTTSAVKTNDKKIIIQNHNY